MYNIRIFEKPGKELPLKEYVAKYCESPVETRKSFKEVCEFIGQRPIKNKITGCYNVTVGNIEYIVTKQF